MNSDLNWFSGFFEGITIGLRSSRSQQTIIIIIIFVFVVLSLLFYFLQRYLTKEKNIKKAHESFLESLKTVSMTKEERYLLEKLAEAHPKGKEQKYLLVQDVMFFTRAAEKLLSSGEVEPEKIRKLRTKLDACCFEREKTFTTTKELPEGLHFYITKSSPEGYHGMIIQRKLDYFAVKLKEQAEELEQGGVCTLFFRRRKDTYRINGVIKIRKENIIYFSHTEEIEKVKKRSFYRTEVNLPAVIRHEGYEVKQYQTKMVDLGGGGCRLESPGHGVHKGTVIDVLFKTTNEETFQVTGEIVKISEKDGKEYLHVHFGAINETLRDKIIGVAMREGEDPKEL